MVDMSAITGLAASLTAAVNITKAMKDFHDANLIQTQVYQLTGEIMNAQQAALAAMMAQNELINRVRELEAEKAKLQAWETEKQRYRFKDFGGHTFAWELKPEAATADNPVHLICPTCFEQRRKSPLQFQYKAYGQDKYHCYPCDVTFDLGIRQPHTPRSSGSSIL
jgi:hypothetical protein